MTSAGCCKLDLVLNICDLKEKSKEKKEKKNNLRTYYKVHSGDIPAQASISHTYLIFLIHVEGKKSIVMTLHAI